MQHLSVYVYQVLLINKSDVGNLDKFINTDSSTYLLCFEGKQMGPTPGSGLSDTSGLIHVLSETHTNDVQYTKIGVSYLIKYVPLL